ncbi:MAG: transglutaminase-like cysteine peptidase [Sphingomicrobium sp.]
MDQAALRPAFRRLSAALALAALPALASAQTASMSAASFGISKSQAILGTTGALDRLLAQQGAAVPSPTSFVANSLSPASAADILVPAVVSGPVSADRPDVFNSVALPIGRTPLEARWSRVERGAPDAPAASFAASLGNRDSLHRLEAVNIYVNSRVHFVDDSVQYGVADYWAPAAQTLHRGKGDCEDFAIAKLAMLRAAGFASRDLYLVIAKDLVRRQDHAVAVARANGRLWVLDSGTDQLLDSAEVPDYRPVLSFSAGHSWTHGYRRAMPPVIMAKAPESAPAPVSVATLQTMLFNASLTWASDQRSRSASLLAFNTGFNR